MGPRTTTATIDDPSLAIDENSILVMRGAGPIGYPGGAEVVNMRPPSYLLKKGINALPCIGDGRQSGTSGIALDPQRLSGGCRRRRAGAAAHRRPGPHRPRQASSQTPWQKYFRELAEPFSEGMVLRGADEFQRVAQESVPRDNH
jgi:dihydroxy-acid dehydratase